MQEDRHQGLPEGLPLSPGNRELVEWSAHVAVVCPGKGQFFPDTRHELRHYKATVRRITLERARGTLTRSMYGDTPTSPTVQRDAGPTRAIPRHAARSPRRHRRTAASSTTSGTDPGGDDDPDPPPAPLRLRRTKYGLVSANLLGLLVHAEQTS